jgi:hypothetical protein
MRRDRAGITLVFSMRKNLDFRGRWIKSSKPADLSQSWWFSATRVTLRESPRTHRHHLCVHPVKSVHALLLFRAEAPAGITPRAQILLHRFADCDVLDLNLIAEIDRSLRRRRPVVLLWQTPLEDGQRSFRPNRHDNIQRDIIGITAARAFHKARPRRRCNPVRDSVRDARWADAIPQDNCRHKFSSCISCGRCGARKASWRRKEIFQLAAAGLQDCHATIVPADPGLRRQD